MVGDDRDDRAIETAATLERGDELADARVDVGDLAVVGRGLETRGERRRRIVRRMCVVEMHPAEERLRAGGVEPFHRGVDDHVAAPLHLQLGAVAEPGKVGIEGIEPLREAVRRGQDEGADEPAGAIAARP